MYNLYLAVFFPHDFLWDCRIGAKKIKKTRTLPCNVFVAFCTLCTCWHSCIARKNCCFMMVSHLKSLQNRCKKVFIKHKRTWNIFEPKVMVTLWHHSDISVHPRFHFGHSVRWKTWRAEPVNSTIHKSCFAMGRQPGWSHSRVIGFILLQNTLEKCSGCRLRLAPLGSKEARRWGSEKHMKKIKDETYDM